MLVIANIGNQKIERITKEEAMGVIGKLPRNKATGVDDIPAEFLQCCEPLSFKMITNTINNIYENCEYPEDFLTSIFLPVPKTSNASQYEEYRTIISIAHACKILLHIIKERRKALLENHVMESQFSFRKDSSVTVGTT